MLTARALWPWLPAVVVGLFAVLAIAVAALPGAGAASRRSRLAALAIGGALAVATTVWQGSAATERIAQLLQQDRSRELAAQVELLQHKAAKLEESTRARSLTADAAAGLADYLRPFGSHKVIVSCAPNDIEAYHYATQLADVLKAANWDARGPETTTLFGDVKAMGINVYDSGGPASDTAKILLDGMTKFGIPYQSRVPPGEALPASDTVELFIGEKPGQPDATASTTPH